MSALNSTFKCSIKMIRTADSNVEKLLLIQVALINTTHLSLCRIKKCFNCKKMFSLAYNFLYLNLSLHQIDYYKQEGALPKHTSFEKALHFYS